MPDNKDIASSAISRRDFMQMGSSVGLGTALAGMVLNSCAKEIVTSPGTAGFIEDYQLIYCLRNGLPTDMDVYEAADWSVVSGLIELSMANCFSSIDFPDFTHGQWQARKPLGVIHV